MTNKFEAKITKLVNGAVSRHRSHQPSLCFISSFCWLSSGMWSVEGWFILCWVYQPVWKGNIRTVMTLDEASLRSRGSSSSTSHKSPHHQSGTSRRDQGSSWRRILLLIIAITVHNIPGWLVYQARQLWQYKELKWEKLLPFICSTKCLA